MPDADTGGHRESRPTPIVWALHDGKAGMASQAVGLAEATGFAVVEKPLAIRFPWSSLPPQLWLSPLSAASGLEPPWPDLVVGCGRNAARPALAIKQASGGRTSAVQVQDPGVGRGRFDLMVVPAHDRLRGPRILVTLGAVHRVTAARLDAERARFSVLATLPRPILSVLLGGSNRAYCLDLKRLAEIADAIAGILRETGGTALVTPSRRTSEAGIALLRDRLAGLSAQVWDGSGANPYLAYLSYADALLVTADSVSMVSEAAATGKPVHILELPGGDAKFARFHHAMRAAGIARPFAGRIESWSYPVPDDTVRAGTALRALVLERLARGEGSGRRLRRDRSVV
jgi:mitochondrial fission protein ELM1